MDRKITCNRKGGEHSTTMSFSVVFALILGIAAFVVFSGSLGGLAGGMGEAQQKGFCKGLLKTRHATNQVQVIPIGDPWLGPAITGTSMFYVSPACGYMYTDACNTLSECQNRTVQQIKYCRQMQKNEPETPRPCLTNLEINVTVTTQLCKTDPNICGTGTDCISAAFGATDASNSMIDYKQCPQKGGSVSMEYDKSRITVKCQGGCANP